VIFQTTLNAWMQKIRPGNTISEENDAKLVMPNRLNHSGRYPFPVTKTLLAGEVLGDPIGSFLALRSGAIGTGLALNPWLLLPPGIWDLDITYELQPVGAVSDLTAVATMQFSITDGTLVKSCDLMRLVGTLAIPQAFQRTFTVSVSKDIITGINLNHVVGLGTATSIAHAQIIGNRIL